MHFIGQKLWLLNLASDECVKEQTHLCAVPCLWETNKKKKQQAIVTDGASDVDRLS